MKTFTRILVLAFCVAFTGRIAHAQYAVFDLFANVSLESILSSSVAQEAQLVEQVSQLKEQIATINNIKNILGNPSSATPRDIDGLLKSIPGLGDVDLSSIFSASGYLDLFMGMSPADFKKAVTDPTSFVAKDLLSRSLGISAGKLEAAGFKAAEVQFAESIARTGSADGKDVAKKVANLLTVRALGGMEENHNRAQALSAIVGDDKKAASAAATSDLTTQIKVMNDQANTANTITLEHTRQANESNAALVSQAHAQTRILSAEEIRQNVRSMYADDDDDP